MFCANCGLQVVDGNKLCVACGTAVGAVAPSSISDTVNLNASASPASAEGGRYAGFWRRVAASLLDSLVILAALLAAVVAMSLAGVAERTLKIVYTSLSWIGAWLYYALMHSSAQQATVGKRAIGIKVTDLLGERIGFGRATGRHIATFLSALTLFIGFAMAGFTARRQALHDMVAGTLVVSKDASPAAIVAGLQAPKVSGGVVALAVLASLVPLTGFLAAITIPAYQDYLIRSQVTEGLMAAVPYQATVVEAIAAGESFENINTTTANIPAVATSPHVDSIQVTRGVVVITYGGAGERKLSGQQLALVPGLRPGGDVVWTCGLAPVPDGVTAAVRAHLQYTSVPAKYLPSACRGQ